MYGKVIGAGDLLRRKINRFRSQNYSLKQEAIFTLRMSLVLNNRDTIRSSNNEKYGTGL